MPNPFGVATLVLGVIVFLIVVPGFFMLQPNQAAAITLFGEYRGTDRATGLRWTWPWMGKKKVSVRANNFISDKIKVNDLRGNPIEMAAQIVWRVVDTAQALFDVDDYRLSSASRSKPRSGPSGRAIPTTISSIRK